MSGAKKSGHLDYPLQSYDPKQVRLICTHPWGILVKMVIHQIWPQKNWKLHSVWFWCISDMVLYLLRWEKQGASLNFVPTHLFGKIQDFFVPGTYWQFLLKSHAKAWISFARPWKSHYNLQIKHTNWKNAFAFKFSIRFDFFWPKSELVIFSWIL